MVAGVQARRLVVTAALVVAGLVLVGCSGGLEPPVPLPTGSATPTPTVTPTVPPTVTPSPTVSPSPSVSPSAPADVKVAVQDNVFTPEVTEIVAGQTVTWVWEGKAVHDVAGEGFGSPQQVAGTFSQQFTTAGSYAYVCTIHNGMNGRIDVKAAT